MARRYCEASDCEVLYEGFNELAPGTVALDIIEKASNWVHAQITEFYGTPSTALPANGASPNFWIKTATTAEAVYLALFRRKSSDGEDAAGYWDSYHEDAQGIIQAIFDGQYRLDPAPRGAQKGIGIAEAVENGTYSLGTSAWLDTNRAVPGTYYEDDIYSRNFYVEMQTIGSTLDASTFRFRTDMNDSGVWEQEDIQMSAEFSLLSYGVAVRFLPTYLSSFEEGMMFKIECYPERDQKNRAVGGETVYMGR